MTNITAKVSRRGFVYGNVFYEGKSIISPNCHIRGDLATVKIGRYCFIDSGSLLRPPFEEEADPLEVQNSIINESESETQSLSATTKQISIIGKFLEQKIGNHTRIGKNCVIEAKTIGSSVVVGDNSVLCKGVVIHDCVYIDSCTVVPPGMVIPPCKFDIRYIF